MNRDEAFEKLQAAVQNAQQGPRQIAKLANDGFDLNDCGTSQHPIFLAIACHHFSIVNTLIDHGVRFDHRDPSHHNASVIQRLRSLREFFDGLAKSPDHQESRSIIKRRLKATQQAIDKYDNLVTNGSIVEIEDSPEPTNTDIANQLEGKLKGLPGMTDALQGLLQKLREGT